MKKEEVKTKKVFKIQDLKIESFAMSDLAKMKATMGGGSNFSGDTKTNACGCHANDNT